MPWDEHVAGCADWQQAALMAGLCHLGASMFAHTRSPLIMRGRTVPWQAFAARMSSVTVFLLACMYA